MTSWFSQLFPVNIHLDISTTNELIGERAMLIPPAIDLNYKYSGEIRRLTKKQECDANKERQKLNKAKKALNIEWNTNDGKSLERKEEIAQDLAAIEEQLLDTTKAWKHVDHDADDRGKRAVFQVLHAFYKLSIGGVLIVSPQVKKKEIKEQLSQFWKEARESKRTNNPIVVQMDSYFADHDEICDCLFVHPQLGIIAIEVKAIGEYYERRGCYRLSTIKSDYKDACDQLWKILKPIDIKNKRSILQQLYIESIASQSDDSTSFVGLHLPPIMGIVCFPLLFQKPSPSKLTERSELPLFDNAMLEDASFRAYWAKRATAGLTFDYRKFVVAMANCIVDCKCIGMANTLRISETIALQNFAFCTATSSEIYAALSPLAADDACATRIVLTDDQLDVLDKAANATIVIGPPGSGKTVLTFIAAVKAIDKGCSVLYITSENLVKRMGKFFSQYYSGNSSSSSTKIDITHHAFKSNEYRGYNYVVCDECNVDVLYDVDVLEQLLNRKINFFIAISGQSALEQLHNLEPIPGFVTFRRLNEVIRNTKSIFAFWHESYNSIVNTATTSGAVTPLLRCAHSVLGTPVNVQPSYRSNAHAKKVSDAIAYLLRELKTMLKGAANRAHYAIIVEGSQESYARLYNVLANEDLRPESIGNIENETGTSSYLTIDNTANTLSFEWPVVIAISFDLCTSDDKFKVLAASRAIAQLIYIERDTALIRDMCGSLRRAPNDNAFASDESYKELRKDCPDEPDVLEHDLAYEIISSNRFPKQWHRMLPKFAACNYWMDFIEAIITDQTETPAHSWLACLLDKSRIFSRFIKNRKKLTYTSAWINGNCEWIRDNSNRDRYTDILGKLVDMLNKVEAVTPPDRAYWTRFRNGHEKLIALLSRVIEVMLIRIGYEDNERKSGEQMFSVPSKVAISYANRIDIAARR